MSTSHLLKVHEEQPSLAEGLEWPFWILPQRDKATGAVRRRRDDDPYTPALSDGDEVFVYHIETGRIIAQLSIHDLRWDNADELFYVESTVDIADLEGPTLADIGVEKATQGARQRLTTQQRDAAVAVLENSPLGQFARDVEAAAMKSIERWRRDA